MVDKKNILEKLYCTQMIWIKLDNFSDALFKIHLNESHMRNNSLKNSLINTDKESVSAYYY